MQDRELEAGTAEPCGLLEFAKKGHSADASRPWNHARVCTAEGRSIVGGRELRDREGGASKRWKLEKKEGIVQAAG